MVGKVDEAATQSFKIIIIVGRMVEKVDEAATQSFQIIIIVVIIDLKGYIQTHRKKVPVAVVL